MKITGDLSLYNECPKRGNFDKHKSKLVCLYNGTLKVTLPLLRTAIKVLTSSSFVFDVLEMSRSHFLCSHTLAIVLNICKIKLMNKCKVSHK